MHRSPQLVALTLILVVLSSACSPRVDTTQPQAATPLEPSEIPASLDDRVPGWMSEGHIAGLSICLVQDFQKAWCGTYGTTDTETGRAIDSSTIFQAASLSKPIFAYVVLQLVDAGLINLDTPLLDYVEEGTAREKHLGESFDDPRVATITARHVLAHTTGFPNWRNNRPLEIRFDPGSRFSYSGEGFGLLQTVVEELTGSSLEDLAAEYVFEPLAMTHSTFSPATADFENYARTHDVQGGLAPISENPERRIENQKPHAAGTLLTSADDYANFLIAVMTGARLGETTFADFLRSQVPVEDDGSVSWGLGIGLEKSGSGVNAWHWGDNGNSKAFFLADPVRGDAVVFFANAYNGLSLLVDLIGASMGGAHPVLASSLLDGYPQHDSPDFRFSQAVYAGGADAGRELIRSLEDPSEGPVVAEGVVNNLGYWLLGRDRFDEALDLFQLNVELYPEAWNAYDSLGEAQLMNGQIDEGLGNYRRSLELNPDNDNARRVLSEHDQSSDSPK